MTISACQKDDLTSWWTGEYLPRHCPLPVSAKILNALAALQCFAAASSAPWNPMDSRRLLCKLRLKRERAAVLSRSPGVFRQSDACTGFPDGQNNGQAVSSPIYRRKNLKNADFGQNFGQKISNEQKRSAKCKYRMQNPAFSAQNKEKNLHFCKFLWS